MEGLSKKEKKRTHGHMDMDNSVVITGLVKGDRWRWKRVWADKWQ